MHLTAEEMSELAENAKKKLSAHCVLRATAVKKVVEMHLTAKSAKVFAKDKKTNAKIRTQSRLSSCLR